ncbi:MAG TPA: hypothetical protein VFS00_04315, partial [Polyangiaceae bacterium]|nr:hypothetical protein [Polyangiaceae bacterium]
MHAHEALGLAREAVGDRDGACEADRVVLGRWGRAPPRSLAAERAGRRALGCPRRARAAGAGRRDTTARMARA